MPTLVSPHKAYWENLQGSTTGDQIEEEAGDIPPGAQILVDQISIHSGAWAETPASCSAHLQCQISGSGLVY